MKYEKKVTCLVPLAPHANHDMPCRDKHHCPYNDKSLVGAAVIFASDKLLNSLKNYPHTSCIMNYTQALP